MLLWFICKALWTAALKYQSGFWLIIVAAVFTQITGLIFQRAVFSRIPRLDVRRGGGDLLADGAPKGWASLCFEGAWHLP